jgi:hypothetical protein
VHDAVRSKIDELLLQQKSGADVEVELDRQLTISLLPLRFQKLCLEKIHIQNHHMLHSAAVDDIGYIIRDIMVQKNHNDVSKTLQEFSIGTMKVHDALEAFNYP